MQFISRFVFMLFMLSTFLICDSYANESGFKDSYRAGKKNKKTAKEATLTSMYDKHVKQPSDINEHLPTLRELARDCTSITEIGVRSMVSTWALMLGLTENTGKKHSYVAIDLETPPLDKLKLAKKLATKNNIKFKFVEGNDMDLDIKETELLFIDSLHTYAHLTYELEKFAPQATKYIALHDTSEPWDLIDETCYTGDFSEYPEWIDKSKRGLIAAVLDFLERHPEWVIKHRYTNNHGLTILQRM